MKSLVGLLVVVACGPPPGRPTAPTPTPAVAQHADEPRAEVPLEPPVQTPEAPEPPPEPRTLHSFPGIDLLESTNFAMHEHGGPAAKLYTVRLEFTVTDRRAHELEARKVEFLRRHCREETWHTRKQLDVVGYDARWGNPSDPPQRRGEITNPARLTVPAGEPRRISVSIRFKMVEAYQACDTFGFGLDIVVDRVRHVFELPLDVTRIEPIE